MKQPFIILIMLLWTMQPFRFEEIKNISEEDHFHKNKDTLVAEAYSGISRILCWVITHPHNYQKQASHVETTWGQHCDVLLFMSSKTDGSLPTIDLHVREGKHTLWQNTWTALHYLHNNYLDKAEWFFKAEDDTYAIIENLRFMLFHYDSNEPIYFGHRLKSSFPVRSYFSGDAGYVISRGALTEFVLNGDRDRHCRKESKYPEDVTLSLCFAALGVRKMDSRDVYGRERFFPYPPLDHFTITTGANGLHWLWSTMYYRLKDGFDCCSDYAISFHGIRGPMMCGLEYLVYHLRTYGVDYLHNPSDRYEL